MPYKAGVVENCHVLRGTRAERLVLQCRQRLVRFAGELHVSAPLVRLATRGEVEGVEKGRGLGPKPLEEPKPVAARTAYLPEPKPAGPCAAFRAAARLGEDSAPLPFTAGRRKAASPVAESETERIQDMSCFFSEERLT